jgi:hypothetical protein
MKKTEEHKRKIELSPNSLTQLRAITSELSDLDAYMAARTYEATDGQSEGHRHEAQLFSEIDLLSNPLNCIAAIRCKLNEIIGELRLLGATEEGATEEKKAEKKEMIQSVNAFDCEENAKRVISHFVKAAEKEKKVEKPIANNRVRTRSELEETLKMFLNN